MLKKRKTALFLIFTFLSLVFLNVGEVSHAQNEQEDYQYQYEKYTIHTDIFQKSRDEYIQYQTLSSKEELITNFRSLMVQRAESQRTYFLLLRQQLRQNTGLIVGEKNELITYLTQETIFLDEHKEDIGRLVEPTLQDLLNLSSEFEANDSEYLSKSYQIVTLLLIGHIRDLHTDSVSINALMDQEINSYPDKKKFFQTWVEEAKSQSLVAQGKAEEVSIINIEIAEEEDSDEITILFNSAKKILKEGKLALDKAFGYQKELLTKMEE